MATGGDYREWYEKARYNVPAGVLTALLLVVAGLANIYDNPEFGGPMVLLGLLVLGAVLAIIPAKIAESKGRSFGAWWVYGFFLWIVALVHILVLDRTPAASDRRAIEAGNLKCPHCAEWIKREARVCRFCSRDVEPVARSLFAEAVD